MSALRDGETYQNRRGDFRGPMRFVEQAHSSGWFIDQYGFQYAADGTAMGHASRSTANINLDTAGTQEGWRESASPNPSPASPNENGK